MYAIAETIYLKRKEVMHICFSWYSPSTWLRTVSQWDLYSSVNTWNYWIRVPILSPVYAASSCDLCTGFKVQSASY